MKTLNRKPNTSRQSSVDVNSVTKKCKQKKSRYGQHVYVFHKFDNELNNLNNN